MEQLNITSAKYVERYGEVVCINCSIDGRDSFIPLDPANRHYAEIMRQVDAGTLTIQDAD